MTAATSFGTATRLLTTSSAPSTAAAMPAPVLGVRGSAARLSRFVGAGILAMTHIIRTVMPATTSIFIGAALTTVSLCRAAPSTAMCISFASSFFLSLLAVFFFRPRRDADFTVPAIGGRHC
eukprot:CAMPEP_0172721860 /NCGR_PEP_ID=MMETSP1074-20121228/80054_1 /TAXON_ID=2916 /ORGANISM="Ceratium fusus, Strain PA161109" /LENGTH=121 /DNA_ID=CAMNT_0013547711 /DNA_START=472 /DNA_END=837 /DNA_ORIENTATION=+